MVLPAPLLGVLYGSAVKLTAAVFIVWVWNVYAIAMWSRVIDYGLLMTSLYPIATYKFTGMPLVIGGANLSSEGFETGGRALLFPEFLKFEWLGPLAAGAFFLLLAAFAVKTVWEWRVDLFHLPKTLHMSFAAVLFFITPALIGGPKQMMVSNLIEFSVRQVLNWPFAFALANTLLLGTLLLYAIYIRALEGRMPRTAGLP